MADGAEPSRKHRSRFWLFAPFALLGLAALAWTAAWFVIRSRTVEAVDGWISTEGAAGRRWTCQDRAVGGYPFRIELSCASLAFERGALKATLGPALAVAQVYQPRHVIAEFTGPLQAGDGGVRVDGRWRLLQASIQVASDGVQRLSVAANGPAFRISGLGGAELGLASQDAEAHLRPDPARWTSEGAYDLAFNAAGATIPGLKDWIGGEEPADLALTATVTQARAVAGRPLLDEMERWRQADGHVEVTRLSLQKGPRRLEARGDLALDDLHRLRGRLDVSAAGIEGMLGALTRGRTGTATAILGALMGRGGSSSEPAPASPPPAGTPPAGSKTLPAPALSPLPPLTLENGRVLFGPFPVPGLRLPPFY